MGNCLFLAIWVLTRKALCAVAKGEPLTELYKSIGRPSREVSPRSGGDGLISILTSTIQESGRASSGDGEIPNDQASYTPQTCRRCRTNYGVCHV